MMKARGFGAKVEAPLNRFLDSLPRAAFSVGGRRIAAYRATVYLSALVGLGVVIALSAISGLSPTVTSGVLLVCVGAVLLLASATSLATGAEAFTFFHYQILLFAVAAAFLTVLGEPRLPYMDALAIGFAVTHLLGRWGCVFAGCCHGKPHRWGIRYGGDQADIGFPRHLVGVRLLPVPLLESLWILGQLVLAGALWFNGTPPGCSFASYVGGYALGRFFLELWRGDDRRAHALGLSEAQWTSVALVTLMAAAQAFSESPFLWHVLLEAGLVVTAALLLIALGAKRKLWLPTHLAEVGLLVDRLANASRERESPERPVVGVTRCGLTVSSSLMRLEDRTSECFALSLKNGVLSSAAARHLGRLIVACRRARGCATLVQGRDGVFFLEVERRAEHAV